VPISVHCQPVPEPLAELFAGSVDVVASCGAVGCHFGAS